MSVAKELAERLLSLEMYEKNLRVTLGLLLGGSDDANEETKADLARVRDRFLQKSMENFPKILEVYIREIDAVYTPEEQEALLAFHKANPWVAAKTEVLQERTWPQLHRFGEETAREVIEELGLFPDLLSDESEEEPNPLEIE